MSHDGEMFVQRNFRHSILVAVVAFAGLGTYICYYEIWLYTYYSLDVVSTYIRAVGCLLGFDINVSTGCGTTTPLNLHR